MSEETVETPAEATAEEVSEAKAMGWSPKEQWRGKPEDWRDVKEFLEHGRQLMPVLRANNQELLRQNQQLSQQLQEINESLKGANAAIAALEEAREEDVRAGVEAARAELKEQLARASEDGDHTAVADLTDKLTQLNTAQKDAKERDAGEPKRRASDKAPPASPYAAEVQQWMREHQAYTTDPERIALANVYAAQMANAATGMIGRKLLEAVYEKVEARLGHEAPSNTKVGSGSHEGASSRRSNGKGYADLPAEAKAVCDRQASRFVGADRKHKTNESWRKTFAEKYFAQER